MVTNCRHAKKTIRWQLRVDPSTRAHCLAISQSTAGTRAIIHTAWSVTCGASYAQASHLSRSVVDIRAHFFHNLAALWSLGHPPLQHRRVGFRRYCEQRGAACGHISHGRCAKYYGVGATAEAPSPHSQVLY